MSILAEPRKKQRLSVDPQNLQWKDDKQKLSRRLMERMGWSEGDGLGRNRQGQAERLKPKANYSGKGLGADKLASYDSTWIGHHEDFADLLSSLNKLKEQNCAKDEEKEEQVKKISLELESKSRKRRIHYQKFVRSKDISNYSPNDRSAVMGIGLRRTKPDFEKTELSNKTQQGIDCIYPPDSNTTVSTLSINEYFAAKMAALKAKTEQSGNETKVDVKANVPNKSVDEEVEQYAEKSRIKKRKKKEKEQRAQDFLESRMLSEFHGAEIKACEKEDELMRTTDKDERRRRKEGKKSRKREQLINLIDEDSRLEVDCSDYGAINISTEEKRTSVRIDKNKADNVCEEISCNAAKNRERVESRQSSRELSS